MRYESMTSRYAFANGIHGSGPSTIIIRLERPSFIKSMMPTFERTCMRK